MADSRSQQTMLDGDDTGSWSELISQGVVNAISGLSEMVGQEITIHSLDAKTILVKDASAMVGGPESETAAIYLGVSGPASGHMVLLYQPHVAMELIEMLTVEQSADTALLGEMEQSILAEMGNIVGSFYLNALSDLTGLDLRVSPPAVMVDMAGAVLDSIMAELMVETDTILVIETTFGSNNRRINGMFLAIPSAELQLILLDHRRSS